MIPEGYFQTEYDDSECLVCGKTFGREHLNEVGINISDFIARRGVRLRISVVCCDECKTNRDGYIAAAMWSLKNDYLPHP